MQHMIQEQVMSEYQKVVVLCQVKEFYFWYSFNNIFFLGCGENPLSNSQKYFEKGCASVYFETKAKAVFHLAILALVAAGVVLLALVLYIVVYQRARAGYAVVSRG
jgi:hypothetical protein